MDNLKYYNDSFAYNYDIFMPAKKKAEIIGIPKAKRVSRAKAAYKANTDIIQRIAIAAIVLAAVCASLFLRAEISSLKAQINGVNKEIVELESESTRLEVEIERKVSLANLEQAATELGMQKCSKSQVTYIQTNGYDTAETKNGKLTAELEYDK